MATTGTPEKTSATSLWDGARIDLDRYLARIGHTGPASALSPDAGTLRELHRAHAAAIPFENVSVLLGRGVPIDVDAIQRKLVGRPRGGYCYEHNLLFAAVLERIGFTVDGRGARIRMGSDQRRPTSHALLRVQDEEGAVWLADVGFGGEGLLDPIPYAPGTEVRQGEWRFRLDDAGGDGWVLRSRHPDGWFDLYSFTRQPHYPQDYAVYNHFTSTFPRSPFTARLLVQQTGTEVRRTLQDTTLTLTHPDGTTAVDTVAPEDLPDLLREEFGVELAADDAESLIRTLAERSE